MGSLSLLRWRRKERFDMGINTADISLGKARLTHPVQLLLVRLEVLPEVGRVDEAVRELEWEQPHLERATSVRCQIEGETGRAGNRPLPFRSAKLFNYG